jgi:penicillin amidase
MCGRLPRRSRGSGLVPLPGWLAENDWDGYVDPQALPRAFNPPEGYFVTANHDLNRYGTAAAINMPMGPYRADRIARLLSADRPWTLADMGRIQIDLYSTQAEAFMERLRPLLPETEAGRILAGWDLCYDVDSTGAVLFEKFYRHLCREVFGRHGVGTAVTDYLAGETGVFADFYLNFDRVLLAQESAWFDGQPPQDLYRSAAEKALQGPLRSWGQIRGLKMDHILFAGRLPSFLGFDRGPYPAAGGRATICQGQIYRSAGRETSFMPSLRLATDLSENVLQTSLAGGPSDRRFSRWYASELADWLSGKYKRVAPGGERLRFP